MITGIVLTKNEENNIVDCLESLTFCSEIIVVDDFSDDRTLEIVKKYKAKVFRRNLDGNYAAQRNEAMEKAKNDWVLFIDADERVSTELQKEIVFRTSQKTDVVGYYIKRSDVMWEKKQFFGEFGNIKLLRLGKKNTGEWVGAIHERWEMSGKTGHLESVLDHFSHPTVAEFLSEINNYTTIRAEELKRQNVKVRALDVILYPKAKFFVDFFLKQGFRDGIRGFLLSIFMSLHSFLVRAKLYMLWQGK